MATTSFPLTQYHLTKADSAVCEDCATKIFGLTGLLEPTIVQRDQLGDKEMLFRSLLRDCKPVIVQGEYEMINKMKRVNIKYLC